MTRRGSRMALAVLTAASITCLAAPAEAAHEDDFPGFAFRCSDFRSQAAAQLYLDGRSGDPDGLDRDNDGRACENYDYGPPRSMGHGHRQNDSRDTPRGGVQAGAGGMADPFAPALPAAGVVLGTALLGAGVVAARRRSTAT